MEQIEVISWQTLDAVKAAASKTYQVIGNLEADEHMSVFCSIEDDYLELFYSELDSNYLRRYDDEEEFFKAMETRKKEFGEDEFDSLSYYEDEDVGNDDAGDEEMDEFDFKDEDDEDEF